MSFDLGTAFIAFLGGTFLTGLAAVWKSGREADKADAEAEAARAQASATMVATADDVVVLVRREMAEHEKGWTQRHDALAGEVHGLVQTVTAWDGWADRVLDILDKAFGLLTDEQKAEMRPDVMNAKDTRPPRYRHYHDKTGGSHSGTKPKADHEA